MAASDLEQERARHEQELGVQRQISFASGLFQGDITIRTLLESLAEGVIIIDNSGTILLVNISAEKMFGYPREDLIGKPQAVLIPERFRKVLEEHEAGYFKEPRIRPMRQLLDLAGSRRDGSEFPVEISLGFIETINGVFVLAFVSDITLRKQLETEIQDAREYAENIVGTLIEPLVVLNSDLRVLTANHSFYDTFQVTPEDTIGNFIYDLGNRQWDIPKLRVLFEEILPHDTVFNGYEVEHDFLDIGRKIILLNARQIFRENIGSHIILLAMEDVTERKSAEEQIKILNTSLAARASELEAANRELEAFNYTVAHDLRKPLTVVNGYCQAIEELCGDMLDEACKGYLRETYEGTLRMNLLIDALLKFSSMAHVEPRRETVDLSAMAHEVAEELKLTEPERRVTFRLPSGIVAEADPDLLRVVLANLFGNAWKYTSNREEGVIEFSATEIHGKGTYFIKDNGVGFDPANAGRLFAPFHRLEAAKEVGGLGIGLATVARIIQRHGGEVWAEGEPGKGATFYFTLGQS
jgi:PAS domain S-box-containing protein